MSSLEATISFAVPEGTPGAEDFGFAKRLTTSRPLTIKPYVVEINDLRKSAEAPKLDVNGFEVQKSVWEGLDGEKGWEDRYTEEMGKWLQGHLGAKRVVTYNYHVRRRIPPDDPEHPKEFDHNKLQPALVAHVDNSQKGAFKRCMSSLELTEEEAKKSHMAVINLWRPIGHPAMDSPLALCDARTVLDEDLDITTDIYGEGSFMRHSGAFPLISAILSESQLNRGNTRHSQTATAGTIYATVRRTRCFYFAATIAPRGLVKEA